MNLNNLKPAEGSVHSSKRVGRGQGSGRGGTSTRGHKGAKSRSGYSQKAGFEGGQMPLQRRVPKRGFKNPFRVEYRTFNLGQIQAIVDKYKISTFTFEELKNHKLVAKGDKIKILGNGTLNAKMDVQVNAISQKAKENIESTGGTVTVI